MCVPRACCCTMAAFSDGTAHVQQGLACARTDGSVLGRGAGDSAPPACSVSNRCDRYLLTLVGCLPLLLLHSCTCASYMTCRDGGPLSLIFGRPKSDLVSVKNACAWTAAVGAQAAAGRCLRWLVYMLSLLHSCTCASYMTCRDGGPLSLIFGRPKSDLVSVKNACAWTAAVGAQAAAGRCLRWFIYMLRQRTSVAPPTASARWRRLSWNSSVLVGADVAPV